MAKATLTFGMDLSDFNQAMRAINRQSRDASAQIAKVTQNALQAYQKGLKELKANPFDPNIKANLARLKEDIKNATTHKLNLDMEQAKKRIFALKEEVIATTLSLGALALPIKTAIDFESAMADVKKVVDFDSKEEIKAFSSELLKMSQIIPMSAQGLTQVASAGAQMGIAKEELFKFTNLVAKTAVAFDITAEQAGDSIGKIKNILALSIDQTGEMMDAINHLSNKNAAKAGEIVETMKRIAGISKQVGITKEQTAALATTFIALGKAPETASSASEALLKKLNNIGSLSAKARKAFESTGLNIKNFQKLMREDAQGGIMLFLETMQKIAPQKRGALLSAIMGINYDSDIATLISGINVYKNALDEVSTKSKFKGSNEAEFSARASTTANSLQLMQNSTRALGISIGNIFLPFVNRALEALSAFIQKINEFIQNNEALVKNLGIAIGSLLALKTAFLGAKLASAVASFSLVGYRQILTKLPFDCLQLSGSLRSCNVSFKSLSAGIIRQISYLRLYALSGGGARGVLKLLGASALTSAKGIGKFSLSLALAPLKLFSGALRAIRIALLALTTTPAGFFLAALGAVALLVYKNFSKLKAFFSGFFQAFMQGIAPISEILRGAFAPLTPIFSTISNFFSSLFSQSQASKESLEKFQNAGEMMGRALANAFNLLLAPLKFIIESIGAVMDTLSDSSLGKWIGAKLGIPQDMPKAPALTTQGAITSHIEHKKELQAMTNSREQNIHNNININVAKTNATAQDIAREVTKNSYAFAD
ncbi:MAG: phage tail tape measure protein [Wolinella sp.]